MHGIFALFNWITIWLIFFFGLLFTILFRFLNKASISRDQRSDAARPLSGWIIFLGVSLSIRLIVQLYFFFTADYFLKSAWLHLQQEGGVNLHSLFIFQMFLSLFAITGTAALIYWYIGRRDIFPLMFIYYVCFYIMANIALFFIYQFMTLPSDLVGIRQQRVIQIARIGIAIFWALYVWRSKQVKRTFIY